MKKIARYCFFILFLGCLPQTAASQAFVSDDPLVIAHLQCRLLQHADWPESAGDDVLDPILSETGFRPDATESLKALFGYVTGGYPDMNFLLGRRWEAMKLQDRKRFNAAFTGLLLAKYEISRQQFAGEGCKPIFKEGTLARSPSADQKLRQHNIIMSALVDTFLASATGPLTVTYVFKKTPPYQWLLEDILIDGESLESAYGTYYRTLLGKSNLDAVIRDIEKERGSYLP